MSFHRSLHRHIAENATYETHCHSEGSYATRGIYYQLPNLPPRTNLLSPNELRSEKEAPIVLNRLD